MKKALHIAIAVSTLLLIGGMYFYANAQDTLTTLNPWKLSGTTITTRSTSSAVRVPSLATTTSNICISPNSAGTFTLIPCGSAGSFTTTTLNGLSSTAYTFATGTDTNLRLTIGGSGSTLTWTPLWSGTLADARITSAATWNALRSHITSTIAAAGGTATGNDFTLATSGPALSILCGTSTCTLSLATSTASVTGVLSAGDWSTFNSKLSAAVTSWGGSTSSTQTYATSGAPALFITTLNGVHTWRLATSTSAITGALTGTDWTTFNNKQDRVTMTAGGNIGIASSSPTWTFWVQTNFSTSTITTATTTNLNYTYATGTTNKATTFTATNVTTTNLYGSIASTTTLCLIADTCYTSLGGKQTNIILATASSSSNTFLTVASTSPTWTFNYPSQWNSFAAIATTTGNLVVASSTNGWKGLGLGTDGQVLTVSSTATNGLGLGWQTSAAGGSGLTSLNGSTSSTQTFASTSETYYGSKITTLNGVHTFDLPNPLIARIPHYNSKIPFGTTFTAVGMTAATPYAGGAAASVEDSQGSWARYTTSTVNGAAGISSCNFRTDWLADASFLWRPSATSSNVIYWIGLGANMSTAANVGTSTPTANLAAFRYSSDIDGTTWQAITNDSSAATVNQINTGITFSTSTPQLFRVRFVSMSSIEFYINNTLVGTSASQIPNAANQQCSVVGTAPLAAGTNFVDFGGTSLLSNLTP